MRVARPGRGPGSRACGAWPAVLALEAGAAGLVNAGFLSPWLARGLAAGGLLLVAGSAAAWWLTRVLPATRRRPLTTSRTGTAAALLPGVLPGSSSPDRWTAARAAGVAAALTLALEGAYSGFLLPGRQVVPVLTYHRVARHLRRPYPVPVTSPGEFAWQLAWLKSHGYRTVSPGYLLGEGDRGEGGRGPAKPLLLTFDDGWRDNLVAARLMRRQGYTGTIFVVTGELGRPLMLTAPQLQELDRAGFTIGSHTVNHLHLDRLGEARRWRELHASRLALERLLGHPVEVFASPYGSSDLTPDLARLARRAGYRLAFASHNFGLNTAPPSRFAVRRLLVSSHPLLARLEFVLFLW